MSISMHAVKEASKEKPKRTGKRILMVAPQPWFRPRGTPFSVMHRIRALLSAGHTIDLATYPIGEDIPMPGLRIFRSPRAAFVNDVKIGPSIAKVFLDWKLYWHTRRLLADNEYDILHTHEEAAFFGVGLAKKHKLLHVYDMHSSLPQQLSNFKAYDLGLFRRFFRGQERRVLTTADGVITICQDLADVAVPDCGETPHAMIENTGDDGTVFKEDGPSPRDEFGLTDKWVALYAGTFETYQGLDLLLDAWKLVAQKAPNAHLLMVGGRPGQVEQYRAMANTLGVESSVTFTGTVHPSRIPGYLRATDIIVSPRSRGTNTPLKIYSYLRSGVPLVATDKPTHTQTLTSETAELVAPTPEGFANGILALHDDSEHARRIGDAGAKFATEHFSDEGYVAKVVDLYDRVLQRAGER